MRAWVFSDLHVDAAPHVLPQTPPEVDAIIIAGDVADGHERSARWLGEQVVPRGLPVVYVVGNHDFYGHDLTDNGAEVYRQAGVELLHMARPTIEIAGARIVGSTLWTDYMIAGDADAARAWARRTMPDLKNIDCGLRRANTRDLFERHRLELREMQRELWGLHDGPTVVVTHHAPHKMSLRVPAMPTPDDASWASDLSLMIKAQEPDVWIHGHVHQSHDYYVGSTRIVCNPRGYGVVNSAGIPVENRGFEPQKVVEI